MQLHPSFLCSISLNILCKLKHTIKSIPLLELKDNYVKERNHLFPSLFFLRFYKVCCTQQVVNNYCLRSHSLQIPKHSKHDSSWNFFFFHFLFCLRGIQQTFWQYFQLIRKILICFLPLFYLLFLVSTLCLKIVSHFANY